MPVIHKRLKFNDLRLRNLVHLNFDLILKRHGIDYSLHTYLRLFIIYGSRMVPGKKNILSGGRHLLSGGPHLMYLAAPT